MKCPVCKRSTGFYKVESAEEVRRFRDEPLPLYQRSYRGEAGYISPRCSSCFDKAIKKQIRRELNANTG